MAAPGLVNWHDVAELGDVMEGLTTGRRHRDDIIVYKAVGFGLQDVALAALAYRTHIERAR